MSTAKSWWSLPPELVAESERMVKTVAASVGGRTVQHQIRDAAEDLGIGYWTVWNAWHGKIGSRAFPKLHTAFHRWLDKQASNQLEALRARIERLEQDKPNREGLDGADAVRRGPEHARAQSSTG